MRILKRTPLKKDNSEKEESEKGQFCKNNLKNKSKTVKSQKMTILKKYNQINDRSEKETTGKG